MSLFKLNHFKFRLTDDEGWRIEIPDLPELTDIGAKEDIRLTKRSPYTYVWFGAMGEKQVMVTLIDKGYKLLNSHANAPLKSCPDQLSLSCTCRHQSNGSSI